MLKVSSLARVCVVCLGSAAVSVSAQEVIHAVTGTVTAINPAASYITVLQDNGSTVQYLDQTNHKKRIDFDKRIAAETTAADVFKNKGAYVIVFYFGGDVADRTVVALKDLGAGPFTAAAGTLQEYDGRAHSLSLQDKTGKLQTFRLTPETVAESDFGVVEGVKFSAHKGDQVRVVASTVDGTPTALFVRAN